MVFHEGFGADTDHDAVVMGPNRTPARPEDLFDHRNPLEVNLLRDHWPTNHPHRALCMDCSEVPKAKGPRCELCDRRHRRRMEAKARAS